VFSESTKIPSCLLKIFKALCVRVIGPKSEASTNILSSAASVCVCLRRAMQLKSNPLNGKERETIE
jgi:hypothetical protein